VPVAQVMVSLDAEHAGRGMQRTGADGRFVLKEVSPGTHTLQLFVAGRQPKRPAASP